jgi:putative ABC transport system permease protein
MGLGIGLGVTLLFALWPLLAVRDVSPLRALRSNVEPGGSGWTDPWRLLIAGSIAAGVLGFAFLQAPTWRIGLGYAGGIVAVFGALALMAWLLMEGVRRFFPSSWSYPWRQGMANLYRPNNQTLVLVLALGLGTFLIVTLLLVQRTLLEQIRVTGGEGRPNLVLFDVQSDQIDGVANLVKANGLPVQERVPIVTMRLDGVKGRSIESMRRDSTADLTWAHRREYRSTYRDHLTESETLVEGAFVGEVEGNPMQTGQAVPISIETEIAREELKVSLGDTLTFDVQGVPLTTYVSSMREVDWQRIGTNFFVVFPEGVLDRAPQTYVVLSNAPTKETSAAVQQAVVQEYPNISAIDLTLVLSTFEELFGKMSYVVRFMALFSILTGLIVLVGAVVVSRMQRVQESVLLKTLGAARSTVLQIMSIEYLFLGVLAAGTGSFLSIAAAWALSTFVFEGPLLLAPWPLIGGLVVVTALTIIIGLINSRGIYNRPPLDVLRAEV